MNCLICGCKNLSAAQEFAQYSVLVCRDCKYGVVEPAPTPDQLQTLYNSAEYYTTHMSYDFDTISDQEINRIVANHTALHSENLGDILNYCSNVLEIGCGGGFALKSFQNRSLSCKGLELSKTAADFAVERLGVEVLNQSLEDFTTHEKFDLVFLNHVLEHFPDPVAAMRKITSLIAQGGYLYVRVPDHDSYDRRKFLPEKPV
jgi:2-polyprenyl-3-methyl-5-hydroxy-6-metoxy-1,4-benzoquinol methylase